MIWGRPTPLRIGGIGNSTFYLNRTPGKGRGLREQGTEEGVHQATYQSFIIPIGGEISLPGGIQKQGGKKGHDSRETAAASSSAL